MTPEDRGELQDIVQWRRRRNDKMDPIDYADMEQKDKIDMEEVDKEPYQGSKHYRILGVEPWDAMKAWNHPLEHFGFLKGCVQKRLARLHTKGSMEEDLEKAYHELGEALDWYKKHREAIKDALES